MSNGGTLESVSFIILTLKQNSFQNSLTMKGHVLLQKYILQGGYCNGYIFNLQLFFILFKEG